MTPNLQWTVMAADILSVEADVLVCSANPYLTLSGGVGGAFLGRYGLSMQQWLQAYLHERGVRHVPPETIVVAPPCGSPYRAVFHAVAVDAAYASSSERITRMVDRMLGLALDTGARTLALPALATGYGNLTIDGFATGLKPLVGQGSLALAVKLCLRHEADAAKVREALELET